MSHSWQKPLNIVASGALVLGALGFSAGAASASSAHRPAAKATTVVFSDYENAPTLNQAQYNGVAVAENNYLLDTFGQSPYYNNKFKLQPGFFKSIAKPQNKGLTYNWTLRSGMKWSNGKPITNKDFLLAWRVESNPASGPACLGSCDYIKSVTLKGKYGIVWHMKQVYGPAPFASQPGFMPTSWDGISCKFSKGSCNGPLSGKAAQTQINNCLKSTGACTPIATRVYLDQSFNYESPSDVHAGPYDLVSYSNTSGVNHITYKPNKYWKASYVGASAGTKFKNLIYQQYTDQPSMINAAARHDTDVTNDYTLLDEGLLRKAAKGNFKIEESGTWFPEELFFNTYNKKVNIAGGGPSGVKNPAADTRVRQALSLSYDRAALIANAYGVSRGEAAKYVSYTNPILSTPLLKAPFADKSITGAWDPIKGKYVKPAQGSAIARCQEAVEAGWLQQGLRLLYHHQRWR